MKKMKNINKKIMLIFIAISLFFIGNTEVNAAKFTKGSNTKIYYSGSKYTYYNKKIGGSIAYCTQFYKKIPSEGANYGTYGSIYNTSNYVAGQIIAIGRDKYSGKDEYLYISEALNCYFKYSGYYSGACNNSKIKNLISTAKKYVSNYKYSSGSSEVSLPKVSITTAGNNGIMADNTGSGTYVSKIVTISGIQTNNYGSDGTKYTSSTPPTYTISLSSTAGTPYLCKNATYDSTCVGNGSKISENGNYYVIVNNGGRVGGNVKLGIAGENTSNYPSAKKWEYSGSKQRMVTKTDAVTIKRNITAAASFSYPKIEVHSAYVEKVDESGNSLTGASLKIYTSSDDKGEEDLGKTICETKEDGESYCVSPELTDDDEYKYTNGRYLCYTETVVPEGYVAINTVCKQINITANTTFYYRQNTETSTEEQIDKNEFDKYNKFGNKEVQYKHENINNKTIYISDETIYTYPNAENYYTDSVLYTYPNMEGYSTSSTLYKYTSTEDGSIYYSKESTQNGEDGELTSGTAVSGTKSVGKAVCVADDGTDNENTDYCSTKYRVLSIAFTNGNAHITVGNALNNVNISKKGITENEELPGATLSIYKADKDGKCSNELATSKKFIYKEYTPLADEEVKDNGSDAGTKSETNTDENASDEEEVTDVDTDEGNEENKDVASTGLTWVSSDTPATIYGLAAGTYCLQEETAPKGYKKATSVVKFTMSETGVVSTESNDNYDKETNTLFITNELTNITISKTDMTTSKELPGAKLSICESYRDENDNLGMSVDRDGDCTVVTLADGTPASWISTDKPKEIIGLGAGTYYLVETSAPNGYETAESIIFTVKEDGTLTDKDGNSLAGNKLVMKDKSINDVKTSELPIIIIFIIGISAIALGTTYYSKKTSLANNSNETSKIRKRKLHKK